MKRSSLIARRATVAAFGLVAATGFLATASIAQPPAGGGGGFGGGGGQRGGGQRGQRGGLTLANTPIAALAAGLKLSDDQKTKIEAAQKPVMDIMKSMTPQPGQQPDRDAMRANYQKMQTAQTQATTDIETILTADQKAAAPELLKKLTAMQRAGIQPGVYADLKLTADQETQIAAASEKAQRKMREAFQAAQGGGGEQPDMRTMMKDAQTQVEAILTPVQKTMLDDYNKAHPMRGMGMMGGGGFGGGGGRRGGGGGNAPAGGGNL